MVYFSRFGLLYPEKNVATRCNYARLVSKQQHGKFKTVRNSGIRTHDHLENFESDAGERAPVLDQVRGREHVEAPVVDGADDLRQS
jgi:hypothetical protein